MIFFIKDMCEKCRENGGTGAPEKSAGKEARGCSDFTRTSEEDEISSQNDGEDHICGLTTRQDSEEEIMWM